jgi:hypothetical protein
MKMKNDKYRKARGGKAFMIHLVCKCDQKVLYYQKDSDGRLKRCYLNRIFAPENLEVLQRKYASTDSMENLICNHCGETLGIPIVHHDGRIAFRLRKGFYTTKREKK